MFALVACEDMVYSCATSSHLFSREEMRFRYLSFAIGHLLVFFREKSKMTSAEKFIQGFVLSCSCISSSLYHSWPLGSWLQRWLLRCTLTLLLQLCQTAECTRCVAEETVKMANRTRSEGQWRRNVKGMCYLYFYVILEHVIFFESNHQPNCRYIWREFLLPWTNSLIAKLTLQK